MDERQIREILQKAKTQEGIQKYLRIMDMFPRVDVSSDEDFQRLYNGFYRMKQRTTVFYKEYFSFLESCKNKPVTFENALKHLYERVNRVEPSFSSKLVHTINPDMPIWDQHVLKHFSLKAPYYMKDRSEQIGRGIIVYKELASRYQLLLQSPEGPKMVGIFDELYPKSPITKIKKIDFVLWQRR
jgi:hypothetical protein